MPWIIDRPPTSDDADFSGLVAVSVGSGAWKAIHYRDVDHSDPWCHLSDVTESPMVTLRADSRRVPVSIGGQNILICSDGSLWQLLGAGAANPLGWVRLPDVPQDESP